VTCHKHNGSVQKVTQTNAAKILGVTREHLNRVLNGHRPSRRLTLRWNEFVRRNGAGHLAV
jgi:hypothetical protein